MTDTNPLEPSPQPHAAAPQAPGAAAPQQYALPPQGYGQPPQYGVPPSQYGQPPIYKNPAEAKNWMNITSLVLSLSGLLLGITAIAGIVFGHLGLAAAKRGEANNRSMGLAGLIIGYVLTALGLLVIIGYIVFIGVVVSQCGGDNPASWC